MQRPGNSFCSTRRPLYEAKLREYRDSQSSGPQVLENSEQAASEYAYKAVLTEMKAGACDMDWTALRNLISLRTRDPELFFEPALAAYRQLQEKYASMLVGREPHLVHYGLARGSMGWARVWGL